jgi:hypothetical protein
VLAPLARSGAFRVHRDLLAGHAWLFDGTTFWTYDDPLVVLQKTLYIRAHGLGGAMVWELSGDDANATLTRTIHLGLTAAASATTRSTVDLPGIMGAGPRLVINTWPWAMITGGWGLAYCLGREWLARPGRDPAAGDRAGVRPTKSLGQNFVHDPNTVRRIVRAADLTEGEVVIEVGPGLDR